MRPCCPAQDCKVVNSCSHGEQTAPEHAFNADRLNHLLAAHRRKRQQQEQERQRIIQQQAELLRGYVVAGLEPPVSGRQQHTTGHCHTTLPLWHGRLLPAPLAQCQAAQIDVPRS